MTCFQEIEERFTSSFELNTVDHRRRHIKLNSIVTNVGKRHTFVVMVSSTQNNQIYFNGYTFSSYIMDYGLFFDFFID